MHDPFFLPPSPALAQALRPWAEQYGMLSLPFHIHEVAGATAFYLFCQYAISPVLSSACFPRHYPRDSRSKRANWDSHVVSLVQSVLISGLALWVMYVDPERKAMGWQERIWGYTGASGMIQALAAGYFVWDLLLTTMYFDVFGPGMLAHAVSALTVFAFGARPFLNYYACVFILYELSTPFLNIHWFFDKLHMTGSRAQLYNGITLLVTFFSCRLVWGTAQSARVYADMWRALRAGAAPDSIVIFADTPAAQVPPPIPVWLVIIYTTSNLTLNSLNWYWFFKMIAAVRKRFQPKEEAKAGGVDGEAVGAAATAAGANADAKRGAAAEGKAALQTGADATVVAAGLRKRRNTLEDTLEDMLEDMVPDSEELREGTIQ